MRIINKKYLLIILLIGVLLTGVTIFKPKENIKLDNVILKQEVNNKTFAMYKEESENNYVPVTDTKFPEGYVLNVTESNCIDNNGNEIKNALSYENGEVTITSGKTIYCYLYFDKTLGVEIKEKEPKGLQTDKIRGEMYRFQGQQNDGINNYICFGTSDLKECTANLDKYMYRIIGIEASTGRVKVIKKEALKDKIAWADNYNNDIEFPKSKIYEALTKFLNDKEYVPEGWENKISDNTWTYGDMDNSFFGANQKAEELYQIESGQNGTNWSEKVEEGTIGAEEFTVTSDSSYTHVGETFYFLNHTNEKWTNTFDSKLSLMYLHDYVYAVGDTANCHVEQGTHQICQTSWIHISQNDPDVNDDSSHEWTMTRLGWLPSEGFFLGLYINNSGSVYNWGISGSHFVRPVFYIDASQTLKDGIGTIDDPFIIKS